MAPDDNDVTRGTTAMFLIVAALFLCGCADAPEPGEKLGHPLQRMQLVKVEGDGSDQWEIWYDTDSNSQILCHHSGYTGSYGGRSTSCVVVSKQPDTKQSQLTPLLKLPTCRTGEAITNDLGMSPFHCVQEVKP